MTLRILLEADLEVHRHYQGKRSRGGFWIELLSRSLNPYFCPVLLVRIAHHFDAGRMRPFAVVASKLNYFLFGLEIARRTTIGPGLYFPHTRGTVLGASSVGARAVIYHGVTVGASFIDIGFNPETRPTIGDDVVIGTGSVVLGHVHVADGARIGAQAVVVKDVEAGAIMLAPLAVPLAQR